MTILGMWKGDCMEEAILNELESTSYQQQQPVV